MLCSQLRRIALWGVILAFGTAQAADYYVRVDGSDSCDGRADRAAGSSSCAFATIARANTSAGCGDTVHIGPGDFYEPKITLSSACGGRAAKVFAGAGVGTTTWLAGAVKVNDGACTPVSGNPRVYRCPKPSGTGTTHSPHSCLLQRETTAVYWKDENGCSGELTGPVCLTRNTIGTADVNNKEGNYYETSSEYFVRPWDDHDPRRAGSAGTGLIAAVSTCTKRSSMAVRISGANITLRGFTMITPCYQAIGITGSKATIENVQIFGGMVWAYAAASDVTYRHLKTRNALRRPDNMGTVTGTSWDTFSQCMATQASRFVMEDIETYGCREGFSLSGGANNGTIDGLFVHGSYNHGLKIQDQNTHDIVIRDALTYNNQEAIFFECPYNIRIENSTFPFSTPDGIIIQGNPGGCPSNRPSNLDFYNNVISSMLWLQYGGDTWAKGGHNLDYNTYISDNGRGYVQRNSAAGRSMSLSSWQNWSSDPCPDCTRDPHGRSATRAEVFKNFRNQDDRLAAGYDFDLRTNSPVVGSASSSWGDGVDIEGVTRSTPRDPGAYDHAEGGPPPEPACSDGKDNDGDGATDFPQDYGCSSASDTSEVDTRACGDGVDNDGDGSVDQADANCSAFGDDSEHHCGDGVREPTFEACDGSDLGGASCVSRGHASGTLACTSTCSFDESGCKDPPPDVSGLHRTDTR